MARVELSDLPEKKKKVVGKKTPIGKTTVVNKRKIESTEKPTVKKIKRDLEKEKSKDTKKPKVKTAESSDLKAKPKAKPKVKSKGKKTLNKSATELAAIRESLAAEGQALLEKLGDNVFDENRAYVEQYKHMFTQLCLMSGIAEEQYLTKKQSRDIYALMKLYDQMREVIADMKALQNVGQYIDAIVSEVINPFTRTASQVMLDLINSNNMNCKRLLDLNVAQQIETHMKSQGKIGGQKLQEGYTASIENIRRILAG